MNHEKLKAHFKGIEDAVGNNDLGGRRRSGLSNQPGLMGDQMIKMDQFENQMRVMNDKIR